MFIMVHFLQSVGIFLTSIIKEQNQNYHTPLLKRKIIQIAQLDPSLKIICNEKKNV